MQFHWQFLTTNSGFWLCCENLILHQKRNEDEKSTNSLMKDNKKIKNICKYEVAFFTLNSPHWPVM